ncbi:hypothetical protein Zm00014a_033316 [Zea mays]|uniref:DUF1421 domain-containing protein n=1 Tax=Zea mays TaxID=4577 RepID=A0A3L6FPC5_MAIZE|nr:hypothetical protein Zm00014a_033316 [Zea mays]
MNASQFMDKQILGLAASASPSGGGAGGGGGVDLSDLMIPIPQEDGEDRLRRRRSSSSVNGTSDDMLPSYDFQPIRTGGATAAAPVSQASWGSLDSKAPSASASASAAASYNLKSAGILEPHVLKKVSHEEDRSNFPTVTIADIDRTMKKYSDNLLHALEGVSSRLSQMEGRTHQLENSVDELKLTIGNYNGSTDGKLRHLENMLREVQAGVQILRDKQEIVEAQLHLAKLQTTKTDAHSSENSGSGHAGSQPVPPPQAAIQPQQVLTPSQPPALPALPAPNAPLPTLQSQPPSQFPSHLQHSQVPSVPSVAPVPSVPALPRDAYYAPSSQPTETMHQQYQAPPVPQPQAPPAPQQYQSPSQFPQYSQPSQPSNVNPPTPHVPPAPQQPEETMPYPPPQSYAPNARPPSPYMQPPSGPAPPYYGQQNPTMYEPPAGRANPGPPSSYGSGGYGPQGGSGFSDSYGYAGSPSHRGNAGMKPSTPFAQSSGGSGGYGSGRLPTAQILPQAVPVSSSSTSGASGNRVPLDDVVEKVATMGFSREQVRATVRRLTENGQNVDLNVVLDKLMNGR